MIQLLLKILTCEEDSVPDQTADSTVFQSGEECELKRQDDLHVPPQNDIQVVGSRFWCVPTRITFKRVQGAEEFDED